MDLFKQDSTTREDLGMLAVMEALAEREKVTQRELSRQTGLNLKKVNYCLHKLLEKGYVKFQRVVHNPDKRAYLYILTPAGLRAKSELTYQFLKSTLSYYNQMEEKLRERLGQMEQAGTGRVVLYGASDAVQIILDLVEKNGIKVMGVVDEGHGGKDFCGLPVLKAADLQGREWDGVLITALENLEKAETQLEAAGVPSTKVWKLS